MPMVRAAAARGLRASRSCAAREARSRSPAGKEHRRSRMATRSARLRSSMVSSGGCKVWGIVRLGKTRAAAAVPDRRRPLRKPPPWPCGQRRMVPCAMAGGNPSGPLQASPSASPPGACSPRARSRPRSTAIGHEVGHPSRKPGRGRFEALRLSSAGKSRNGAPAKSTRMRRQTGALRGAPVSSCAGSPNAPLARLPRPFRPRHGKLPPCFHRPRCPSWRRCNPGPRRRLRAGRERASQTASPIRTVRGDASARPRRHGRGLPGQGPRGRARGSGGGAQAARSAPLR